MCFMTKPSESRSLLSIYSLWKLITQYLEEIESPGSAKVDTVEWNSCMTLDVVGDLALGGSFQYLGTQRYHPGSHMILADLEAISNTGARDLTVTIN